ncbi:MAG: histidine kinase [Actinomycetota bacterium]
MTTPVAVDRKAQRLRTFILLDAATTAVSVVFVIVIRLVAVDNDWLWVVAIIVAVGGVAMAAGLRPLARGDLGAALLYLSVANWGVALCAVAIATFAWPIMVLASLLPAVFAVPYVSAAQLRVFVAMSFMLSVASVAIGLGGDFSGLTEDAPGWVRDTVLFAFTPFMSLLVVQAGLASSRELQATLGEALDANDELTASRARLVAATDRERRRIERDLHDGAQQRLVGMSVHLALAKELTTTDPDAAAAVMSQVREQLREAQRELRQLVRGVYPPVLSEHGLPAALRAVADEVHLPIELDIEAVGRHDADVEAAVYFCVLEALQNAGKHAGPDATVHLRLREDGSWLEFAVSDDGRGFDSADRLWGSGFTNMQDRLGAARGTLDVRSADGRGTTVTGRVPT